MTFTLSHANYRIWMDEAAASSGTGDSRAWSYHDPSALGRGLEWSFALWEDIERIIAEVCLSDDLENRRGDRPHPLEYTLIGCTTRGSTSSATVFTAVGSLYGSGLSANRWVVPRHQHTVSVNVYIGPDPFQQWLGNASQDAHVLDFCDRAN